MSEMPGCRYRTTAKITWCPGCPDHMILESTRRALLNLKGRNFAMVAGIGCHGKIFDYLHISGINSLHGRSIPTATGIRLANPELDVIAFTGDGDTYTEGMQHFIHACRTNPNITLVVNNNQAFSLTTGQATATSQKGYRPKSEPLGSSAPINPILTALAAGASFVARCNARDIEHTREVLEKAIKHNGFSYIDIIQDCLVFNTAINNKDKFMYKIAPKKLKSAMAQAQKFDYNQGRIPIGIFYKEKKETLEERWRR